MAGEHDVNIQVTDDTVVTVDIPADLAAEFEAANDPTLSFQEVKEAATPPAPPQRVTERQRKAPTSQQEGGAADEAAKALQASVEAQRRRADAAEATATAERARAENAARAATAALDENRALRERADVDAARTVDVTIDAAKSAIAAARQEYVAAAEMGDHNKMADAQVKIGEAASDLRDAQRRKADIDSGNARRAPEKGRVVEAPPVNAFEQYVGGFSARAQSWLRAHPDCAPTGAGGRQDRNDLMMHAHYTAKTINGFAEGSDDYFKVLDEIVDGVKRPGAADEGTSQPERRPPQQQARKAPPAQPSAPVSRDAPNADGSPTRAADVRLSPPQQEIALLSFPQREKEDEASWRKRAFGTYALEFVKAKAEGKIGRMTH